MFSIKSKKRLHYLGYGVFLFIILSGFVRIITNIIYTKYPDYIVCNHGISFGIIIPSLFFWISWIITISFIFVLIFRSAKESLKLTIAYIFIFVGGLNNVVDRLIYGCVVDYIRIVPWNVFNLSDVLIFIGAIIILYSNFSKK